MRRKPSDYDGRLWAEAVLKAAAEGYTPIREHEVRVAGLVLLGIIGKVNPSDTVDPSSPAYLGKFCSDDKEEHGDPPETKHVPNSD